jgi:hypothetical protein
LEEIPSGSGGGIAAANEQKHVVTLQCAIPYKNQSKLYVQIEIVDQGGSRVINIFVPYWIVNHAHVPLHFQLIFYTRFSRSESKTNRLWWISRGFNRRKDLL